MHVQQNIKFVMNIYRLRIRHLQIFNIERFTREPQTEFHEEKERRSVVR